jgi:hypothetical protein
MERETEEHEKGLKTWSDNLILAWILGGFGWLYTHFTFSAGGTKAKLDT